MPLQRDVLCHLIHLQHNVSKLDETSFLLFCMDLIESLSREQIESLLFNGLNAMRMNGCRASLKAKAIIDEGTRIARAMDLAHKADIIDEQQQNANNIDEHLQTLQIESVHVRNQLMHLPPFLSKYVCDFLFVQSLLRLQRVNRYFFVIARRHRSYALLLMISPYNSALFASTYPASSSSSSLPRATAQPQPHEIGDGDDRNGQYLHSVNETALNSGYYKKFFIPIRKLGKGSYGQVFLVNHVMHGIYLGKFAMKIVCVGDDIHRLIDILREVRALQQLHHRNVIDYKHSWLENYQPAINGVSVPCLFVLMEFADMGSVFDYVLHEEDTRGGGVRYKRTWLEEHEIWSIMFETCMGLQHLHQHGIVHRDIKPCNLLMTSLNIRHKIEFQDLALYDSNYRIVISDLGQADFVHHKESAPQTGMTGAFGFASPELVLRGDTAAAASGSNGGSGDENDADMKENNPDAAADAANADLNSEDPRAFMSWNEWDESVDVWSLGQLLYFLTFSRMPYEQCWMTNDDDEDLPDIHDFYRDIVRGKHTLYFPPGNAGRSQIMVDMIRHITHIDPTQRPSLDAIVSAIADILRSHNYISISYNNNELSSLRALTAPLSCSPGVASNPRYHNLPVIKYEPSTHKLLL